MNKHGCNCVSPVVDRRDFLRRSGLGFGGLAFASLLAQESARATPEVVNPLAAKPTMFPAKAKNVIFLFMDGGPSHIDLFDPKPALQKYAGQPLPASFPKPMTAMGSTADAPLLASKRTFRQHGASGIWVSDWYPQIAKVADDLCVLRGCVADGQTHVGSVCQMNTGAIVPGRASIGAWTLFGLGSENEDLPGFVTLCDTITGPPGGSLNWSSGYLPATYQGTKLQEGKSPFTEVIPPPSMTDSRQRSKLDFIQQLNQRHAESRPGEDRLAARLLSYELAYRMQAAAPEAVDLASESAATLALYGIGPEDTTANGRNCLLARRFVERGVRFVQVYMGGGSRWDAHSDIEGNHVQMCKESDHPIAGLIADLKHRGLLESTLVIWGGEFGRTPMSEGGDGRDHNPFGFTMWFAGGGVKPGFTYGATDELGLYATEGRMHVHDIHATILHLLGMDHEKLTYLSNGRDERLTIVAGQVAHDIIA